VAKQINTPVGRKNGHSPRPPVTPLGKGTAEASREVHRLWRQAAEPARVGAGSGGAPGNALVNGPSYSHLSGQWGSDRRLQGFTWIEAPANNILDDPIGFFSAAYDAGERHQAWTSRWRGERRECDRGGRRRPIAPASPLPLCWVTPQEIGRRHDRGASVTSQPQQVLIGGNDEIRPGLHGRIRGCGCPARPPSRRPGCVPGDEPGKPQNLLPGIMEPIAIPVELVSAHPYYFINDRRRYGNLDVAVDAICRSRMPPN